MEFVIPIARQIGSQSIMTSFKLVVPAFDMHVPKQPSKHNEDFDISCTGIDMHVPNSPQSIKKF